MSDFGIFIRAFENNLAYYLTLSLILTVVIECLLCIPLIKKKRMMKKDLLNIVLVNCLTNPIVVCLSIDLYNSYFPRGMFWFPTFSVSRILFYLGILTCMECVVVLIEGFLLKRFIPSFSTKAYKYSLYLNSISYLIGVIPIILPIISRVISNIF